jgi:hypothetical protein
MRQKSYEFVAFPCVEVVWQHDLWVVWMAVVAWEVLWAEASSVEVWWVCEEGVC